MRYLLYTDVHFCRTSSIVRSIATKYTTRLENGIKSVSWAEQYAEEHNVDEIICLGDFFQAPDLTSQELTALQDIRWSPKPHTFLVGNHDTSTKDLKFNSVNALKKLGFDIIEVPTLKTINKNAGFILVPYLQDDDRKTISEYVTDFNLNHEKAIILSHNDVHCQYGPYKNESGFEIDDIENNCDLFLNGHIHNMYHFCKNGFNIGNLTGQNFNEDAFNYIHPIFILDVSDDGEINLEIVENPYAFNFYQVTINNEADLSILNNLKSNAVVSVRCDWNLIESVKAIIKQNPNIIESKKIRLKDLTGNKEKLTLKSINNINHLDELDRFVINSLGDSPDVRNELNKIKNN